MNELYSFSNPDFTSNGYFEYTIHLVFSDKYEKQMLTKKLMYIIVVKYQ